MSEFENIKDVPHFVKTGLERLIEEPPKWMSGKRLGLLCNPASIDSQFRHARRQIDRVFPGRLKALFSPQHGFFAEKQDNMIASQNLIDPVLKIPVFSLYGQTRIPTREMLDGVDILIIDLQDVGTRVYTFIYTMSYCLESAQKFGKKVVILDRPNPIGGSIVAGNCLSETCISFVGRYPIPMRHGLTIAELALLFNEIGEIGCDLEVIPMSRWQRGMLFGQTGLPWIPPSPNMPTPVTALVYPGQVLWEGTNISEGRGTTQPFEICGAPFLDTDRIFSFLGEKQPAGCVLRPVVFEPTSNKWQGELCNGFQIHITDPYQYQPYVTSLKLLQAFMAIHADRFEWKNPPYEYEFARRPIDLIIGDKKIRKRIENQEDIADIAGSWQNGLDDFKKLSRPFHLYPNPDKPEVD